MTQKTADEIKRRFLKAYQSPKTELQYHNLYELLVCVMLSAQCTDKRVNVITPNLFKSYPNINALANAPLDNIKDLIKSCSFFNNKAKNLKNMATEVLEKYNGEIPKEAHLLQQLSGVGQKTANVVMIEYFEANLMAVDTHVFRVSHRLGLSSANTPKETEKDLTKLFKTNLAQLHQAFVLFGRYTCKAVSPKCDECFVRDLCQTSQSFKPR